jgi:hypothetical protein
MLAPFPPRPTARACYSEATSTRRPRSTGGAISPMTLNLNGQHGRVGGNPGGSPEATRRAFNKRFLVDLAEDWQQHGREVFKRVRRESPAAYLKVCANRA